MTNFTEPSTASNAVSLHKMILKFEIEFKALIQAEVSRYFLGYRSMLLASMSYVLYDISFYFTTTAESIMS